jgi:rhomboid protease GluP
MPRLTDAATTSAPRGHAGITERLYGSARFAVIYLLAALSGNVVSGWWDPSRNSPGVSGAVFEVFGALSLCIHSLAMGFVMPYVDNAAIGGLLGGALASLLLVRPFEPVARAVPQSGMR